MTGSNPWQPHIQWVLSCAEQARWDAEVDLAVMTSHAFQCLFSDEELRSSLTAISVA
jgi:hypothetical protein